MKNIFKVAAIALTLGLTGCAADGQQYRADAFAAETTGFEDGARIVKIVNVGKAKVYVDNAQQKQAVSAIGSVLGAVAGGIAGYSAGGHRSVMGAVVGVAGGAGLGAAAGAAVKDKVAVDGVLIAYRDEGEEKLKVAKHVGRLCEYAPGQSLAVGEGKNVKIQPNAECPAEK